MEVKKITVSAGRTFNHPYEQFSNFRFHVGLEAETSDGDNISTDLIVKGLQEQAEKLCEEHKEELLKNLKEKCDPDPEDLPY